MKSEQVQSELKLKINKDKAEFFPRFFKTAEGQYGYGDKFLGIVVPDIRKVAKEYRDLDLTQIEKLLKSEWHEERLCALLILVYKYEKNDQTIQKQIFDFYLSQTKFINNWDLVDLSASQIVGTYLLDKPRDILYKLAKSDLLWEKRIAIIATFAFIRNIEFKDTFEIAEILLTDKHDLIHKAVGWMLREVGKRCGQETLEIFLQKHYKQMPRTMLRYSIEHFSAQRREHYMKR